MRGLYSHVSDRMREELKHSLQLRWEESLRERAALSPVPALDRLLAPLRERERDRDQLAARPVTTLRTRKTKKGGENLASQIPPKSSSAVGSGVA